jgi:hypothetical protein
MTLVTSEAKETPIASMLVVPGGIASECKEISPRKIGRYLLHVAVHVQFRDATHGSNARRSLVNIGTSSHCAQSSRTGHDGAELISKSTI